MQTYTRAPGRRARRPGVLPYALDEAEITRWLGEASEETAARVLSDSLGWCKRHPPLEAAQRALEDLMLGRALAPESAPLYRSGVLHLCQHFGRAMERDALQGLDWEQVSICDRVLLEMGAPWTMESMLDGPCLMELPEGMYPSGTGWFDTQRCEEIDGFFEDLEREEFEAWLEEVGGGEQESEMFEEIERWFAFVAERGWALATFWS